jgi:hypothetical protein
VAGTAVDGHLVGLAGSVGGNGSTSRGAKVRVVALAREVGAIGSEGRSHVEVLLGSVFVDLGSERSRLDHLHVGRCEGGTKAKNGQDGKGLHVEAC